MSAPTRIFRRRALSLNSSKQRFPPTALPVLKRSNIVVFSITGIAVAITGVLQFTGGNEILRFVSAAIALSLLAMNVSSGTEQAGNYLSAGATGVLQAALGNLPELLVCAFSLRAGLLEVVQAA